MGGTKSEYVVDIWSGNHPFFQAGGAPRRPRCLLTVYQCIRTHSPHDPLVLHQFPWKLHSRVCQVIN